MRDARLHDEERETKEEDKDIKGWESDRGGALKSGSIRAAKGEILAGAGPFHLSSSGS